MAVPAIGLPLLGKVFAAAKGLLGAKKAAAAVKATQLGIPGLTAGATKAATGKGLIGGAKRFAGEAFTNYLGGKPTVKNLAENFGLDAVFGGLAAAQTPGDLGDKLIAGTTVGLSGGLGGMIGTTGYGKLFNKGQMPTGLTRQMTEVGGALLGDTVGMSVSDNLQRMKGGGLTAWEREAQQSDELYRKQLEQEILAKYGILGQPYQTGYGSDPFLVENGLA
tara:strand:+ start:204 stop:866 length:663 start_codon:yes stop_codon:yes gene_type:complete